MTESNIGPSISLSGESPELFSGAPTSFVSYASHDQQLAEELVAGLESQGLRCWIAPRDVPPGTLYADAIIEGINSSSAFVLVLSASAIASRHVGKELERASSKRKTIYVVRIDKTPLTHNFEYFLSESQWIELGVGGMSAALAKLGNAVRRLNATPPPSVTDGATSIDVPTSDRRIPWLFVLIGVVCVLAVLVVLIGRTLPHSASESAPATKPVAPAEARAVDASVAVLPFADLSEKQDQEFFSDGLSEEIIDRLSAVPELKVPPRSSSFYFKGKHSPVGEIASALGVVHVLEGSVRRSGDKLRVTAQLIRADSGHLLWSQTFDRHADDIFKIQDDIARAVVSALKGRLKASLLPESTGTKSAEAYGLYFQASQHYRQAVSQDDSRHALEEVNKALALDGEFAQALALKSSILDDLGSQAEALQSVSKALELNPKLGMAHFALARIHLGDYDLPGTEKESRRALELDPDLAAALDTLGLIDGFRGQFTQSIEKFQRVIVMDPVNSQRYFKLAEVYFNAARYPEAMAAMARAQELQPGIIDPHAWSSTILFAQGKMEAALAELDLATDENQRLGCGCRTNMLDALGRKTEANAAFAKLIEAHASDEAYGIASVYARRGDADQAFEWLDRAYSQKEITLYWIKVDADFKRIRNDPRFHALLLKLQLIDA